jgi:hypothetical protein
MTTNENEGRAFVGGNRGNLKTIGFLYNKEVVSKDQRQSSTTVNEVFYQIR